MVPPAPVVSARVVDGAVEISVQPAAPERGRPVEAIGHVVEIVRPNGTVSRHPTGDRTALRVDTDTASACACARKDVVAAGRRAGSVCYAE